MEITYKLRVDAPYFKTLIDRYYQQRSLLLGLPFRFAICSLPVIGTYLWNTTSPADKALGISVAVFLLIVLGGVALTKIGILYRFKWRADFGTDVTVTLSESGVAASGNDTQGKWGWASYPTSVRYSDGILLMRAGVIRWLPDSAILNGSVESVRVLVGSRTKLRRVA